MSKVTYANKGNCTPSVVVKTLIKTDVLNYSSLEVVKYLNYGTVQTQFYETLLYKLPDLMNKS